MKNSIFIIVLILFLTIASWNTMKVGPYYDELLHAVAASQMVIGESYTAQVHHVLYKAIGGHTFPLMILYYVGPVKAYALALLFLFTPETIEAVRVFTIVCGAITLMLTIWLTKKYIGIPVALITSLFLATDPSFILSSRYDWGPVSLQNIGKLVLIISLWQLGYGHKKAVYAAVAGIVSSLLVWDKLNAIWFVAPAFMVFLPELVKIENKKKLFYTFSAASIIALFPFLIFVAKRPMFYTVSSSSFAQFEWYLQNKTDNNNLYTLLKNYSSGTADKLETMQKTLNGTAIPEYILATQTSSRGIHDILAFFALLYAIIVFVLPYVRLCMKKKSFNSMSSETKITVLVLTILVAILITPHANGPHHMLMVFPFIHILTGIVVSRQKVYLGTAVVVVMVITNLSVMFQFIQESSRNNMKPYWQWTDIREVTQDLERSGRPVIAVDWGITLPVGFLSQGKVPISDLQAFYEPKCNEFYTLVVEKGYTVIRYTEQKKVFPTYYEECSDTYQLLTKKEYSQFQTFTYAAN